MNMKMSLTIVTAVIISVAIMLLMQRHQKMPDSVSDGVAGRNTVRCGLDVNGHIVPDGKGGCIPPPPDGHIVDVRVPIPEGVILAKYPTRGSVSAEEMERICPWKAPVSEACQSLYVLPKGVSCVGKPFSTCIVGEKP